MTVVQPGRDHPTSERQEGDARPAPPEGPARTPDGHGARRPVLLIVIGSLVVLVVVAAAAVLARRDRATESTSQPGGSTASVPMPTPPSPTATVTSPPGSVGQQPGPSAPVATAADDLAGFFAAAQETDRQLRTAAAAVNASIRQDVVAIDEQTVRAVAMAAPGRPASLIPAGMPPHLRTSVLRVYSDLEWRWAAMQCVSTTGTWPIGNGADNLPPACLGDGTVPAERFADDLAAARRDAAATPAPARVPKDSRAVPEVAILTGFVNILNAGCAGRGGYRVTDPPAIEWLTTPQPDVGSDPANVRVTATRPTGPESVLFRATYDSATGSWTLTPLAC